MNSIEESLRNWCIDSIATIRAAQPSSTIQSRSGDIEAAAEWIVETAAFRRMLDIRGLPFTFDKASTVHNASSTDSVELINQVSASCPLSETDRPEVLGTVHEFLTSQRSHWGKKTIRRSAKSRKTNGVFYTPQYVIDEIVRQTIGPRLADATPERVAQIKILDPAAGCGAFLVAAFRYLIDWHVEWLKRSCDPEHRRDVVLTDQGWKMSFARAERILVNNLFGVDLDQSAVDMTRRILWLTLHDVSGPDRPAEYSGNGSCDLAANFQHGHSLIGDSFCANGTESNVQDQIQASSKKFDWSRQFPTISRSGGFDVVIGNPPYRRERDFKPQLDEIMATPFGRRYQSPRMDLCYFFIHRGIELLKPGGTLSFITSAYWIQGLGADKLIAVLRDETQLDELFLLGNLPVFAGVSGQHVIFRLTKSSDEGETTIKVIPRQSRLMAQEFFTVDGPVQTIVKTRQQLFQGGRLNVSPVADRLLGKFKDCSPLIEFGCVRQGIAENPSTINRRTLERFRDHPLSKDWVVGEGVFSLSDTEVTRLSLEESELKLLRPYHELCDLSRYWSASKPLRRLIYSTRNTCSDIEVLPNLRNHLARFRPIMEARRETAGGHNCWWHLHWPRNESLWQSSKLISLQMAARPSFVPIVSPSYVSFSANVFVPAEETHEGLNYFCGLLNSRLLWAWFAHHAKRRGIGLELNGHVLQQAPIRRINFQSVRETRQHDDIVELVHERLQLQSSVLDANPIRTQMADREMSSIEARIDDAVASLYGLDAEDIALVDEITESD